MIGNIIHEAFEKIILKRNFEENTLTNIFKESMKNHYCHLYKLRESETKVLRDLKTSAKNILSWVKNMLDRKNLNYSLIVL